MKINIVTMSKEIEISAEEIRQSNSVADAITGALRRLFNGEVVEEDEEEDTDDLR